MLSFTGAERDGPTARTVKRESCLPARHRVSFYDSKGILPSVMCGGE